MKDQAIKGIVFDLDGVMLDSEALSILVWRDILARYDAHISNEVYESMIGMASMPAAKLVIAETGVPMDAEEILRVHWDMLVEVIEDQAKAEKGLIDLLDAFSDRELPMAVASNSPSQYVHSVLASLKVRDRFLSVICADEITHAKPHPEIYLKAAEAIGIAPEHCLAIEDSPIGLEAALAAGMRCAVIPNHHLKNPDYTGAFGEYASLSNLLENLSHALN